MSQMLLNRTVAVAMIFLAAGGGVIYTSVPAMASAWTPTIESNYYATSLDYPDHVQVICELTVENITWDDVSYWSNAENRWMPLGHGTARHYRPAGLGGGVDHYPVEIYWKEGQWVVNPL